MSISATSLSQLFTLADTNSDKSLSTTELATVDKSLPNPTGASTANLLKSMDSDSNGILSETEFTQGVQLNEQVANALLSAQELTGGGTFLSMLDGSENSSDSIFSSLSGGNSSSSSSSYGSLLQNYVKTLEEQAQTAGVEVSA